MRSPPVHHLTVYAAIDRNDVAQLEFTAPTDQVYGGVGFY
jgi:hypothetical protein